MGKAVDVRISGLVQGVSFRAYTQQQARGLGVRGWVRNEPDGSVTGHFEGPADAVDALVAWCRGGPAYAEVDGVEVAPTAETGARTFDVLG
jgi:acylphosphatase